MKAPFFFFICLLALLRCSTPKPAETTTQNSTNRKQLEATAKAILRYTNANQNDSLLALFAPDVKIYINGDLVLQKRDDLASALASNQKEYTDVKVKALNTFIDSDHIILQLHTAMKKSDDKAAKTIEMNQVRIDKVSNGIITEEHYYYDNYSFMKQTGYIK